jgi:hypothetical protein
MAIQSVKRFADPRDTAAFAVFFASDSDESVARQMLPKDNDLQKAS